MIQDMYDPEYYYQKYSVVHKESTIRTVKKGKYLDTAFCEVSTYVQSTIKHSKNNVCCRKTKPLNQKAQETF